MGYNINMDVQYVTGRDHSTTRHHNLSTQPQRRPSATPATPTASTHTGHVSNRHDHDHYHHYHGT